MLLKQYLFPLTLELISSVSLEASLYHFLCPPVDLMEGVQAVLLPWSCFSGTYTGLVARVLLNCRTCLWWPNTTSGGVSRGPPCSAVSPSKRASQTACAIIALLSYFLPCLQHRQLIQNSFSWKSPWKETGSRWSHCQSATYPWLPFPKQNLSLHCASTAVCMVAFSVTLVKWAGINQNYIQL